VARPSLTTTSYAILGLLAIRPWSTYELTRQMDRSLGRVWPRAQSKLYEAPKKLVADGLARATDERVGRRPRTVYSITPAGRRALADWLGQPGEGPVLEFENLLKVFFAESGTTADVLSTLAATHAWARARSAESAAVGREYLEGRGRFPGRQAQLDLTARFLTDFYAMVAGWAEWAAQVVEAWPDDPGVAAVDPAIAEGIVATAETTASAAPILPEEQPRGRPTDPPLAG
jgi:PadR family transcriptional regulator, regulatory protein AphA